MNEKELELLKFLHNITPKYIFDIEPVAAPRMTQSDRWKKRDCVVKYFQYKKAIFWLAKEKKYTLQPCLNVCFVVKMADGWPETKKEKMFFMYHQQRPDIDNYTKALMDSFGVEDGFVCDVRAVKIWGYKGSVIIF